MNDKSMISSEPGTDTEQIVAWVGLDWADKEHKIALYETASGRVESGSLKNTAEAIHEWLAELKARYSGGKVAVVLEQSRGSVLYAMMDSEFIVLYPVTPQAAHSYRKAFATSGAKDDPTDAELLRDIVRKHLEKFRPWVMEDADIRSIRLLVEDRRELVDQLTRLTNQLTSCLKNYYPQALGWAGELTSRQACDFLTNWPALDKLQAAKPGRLRKFYMGYGRPSVERINQRLEDIKRAVPLTRDTVVVGTGSLKAESLVTQIRSLPDMIKKYDKQIKQLFDRHPDHLVFDSFPGAGAVMGPRLMAALGVDRDRWKSAAEIQNTWGIAPVTVKSGNQRWVHYRWACSKFQHQTFHDFAALSIPNCDWARAFYDKMRKVEKKGRHAAIRALAYKWIRILFRCWKDRVPYDDDLYMRGLQARHSPLPALVDQLQETKRNKTKAA